MRIGFFTSVDGWGGSEMYLKSLMMRMGDMGHQAVLFGIYGTRLFEEAMKAGITCLSWRRSKWIGPAHAGGVSEGKSKGPHARRLRKCILRMSPSGVAHILCDASELAACLRLFSHEPVDVMHVNINEYYEVAGIACKLRGIPCLGMCCAFPGKNEGYRQRHLTRWIPKLHTAVASKSLACINAWQRLCDLSSHKCRFIWNGVDLQKFGYKKREPAAQGRPFRLLAVGRLHPMKGLDVLVRAIRLLRNKDVVLSIAGHGEKQHKEGLERLVSDLNLSSKVRFLGYVEDVVPLYRKTDCTVSASVAHESFGQTLIEAMACGSPLITSDFGPFPEINLHKVTGLVVPAHNTSHLAMAISTMMDEEGFRIQMGRRARERAERLFSQDRMIDKTVDLYAELAENQRQD